MTDGPLLVILDRDGTLNVPAESGQYVTERAAVLLLPGVAEAVGELTQAGATCVVATNQRCIRRGLATPRDVAMVNREVTRLVARGGGRIARYYVCPHGHGECRCRKPLPGLLLEAMRDYGSPPSRTWMVGDSDADLGAARAAGVAMFRVSGRPDGSWGGASLEAAVAHILQKEASGDNA